MKRIYSYWMIMFYVYAVSFSLAVVAVFGFYFYLYYSNAISTGTEYSENLLDTSMINFDREMDNYISIFHNFIIDGLREIIQDKDILIESGMYEYKISQELWSYVNRTTDAAYVIFFDNDGHSVGVNVGNDSKYIEMHNQNKDLLDKMEGMEFWKHDDGNLLLCKKIFSFDKKLESLGYIYIIINDDRIVDSCIKLNNDKDEMVVYNHFGEIVLSSNPELLGHKKEEVLKVRPGECEYRGMRYRNFSCDSKLCNIKYEYMMNLTQFWQDMIGNTIRFMIVIFCCVLIVMFLVKQIYKKQGRPIRDIVQCMNDVSNGNLKSRTTYNKNDEIGFMSLEFNKMMERLDNQVNVLIEMDIQLKNAQLRAYENQINPHFLYNTLDLIRMMALNGDSDKIESVIVSMANLLRYNLSVETEVLMKQEIKSIEDYFRILSMRFGDKFDYNIDVAPEVVDCKILKFLIQPLIENSIRHGIEKKQNQGYVELSCRKVGDEIAVIVRDNGVGMSEEELQKLKVEMYSGEPADAHIGIRNIYKRISIFYQGKGTIDFYSRKNEMTMVLLKIPYINSDGNEVI